MINCSLCNQKQFCFPLPGEIDHFYDNYSDSIYPILLAALILV